jgi:hypothetical protein
MSTLYKEWPVAASGVHRPVGAGKLFVKQKVRIDSGKHRGI